MTFGEYVKQRRLTMGLSLRKFTASAGLDPSNYSKIERGVAPAPTGDSLAQLGAALQIENGSAAWVELEDLAAASRAVVPSDLEADRVAAKLPLFFRALRRGEQLTRADLDELVEKVKDAG